MVPLRNSPFRPTRLIVPQREPHDIPETLSCTVKLSTVHFKDSHLYTSKILMRSKNLIRTPKELSWILNSESYHSEALMQVTTGDCCWRRKKTLVANLALIDFDFDSGSREQGGSSKNLCRTLCLSGSIAKLLNGSDSNYLRPVHTVRLAAYNPFQIHWFISYCFKFSTKESYTTNRIVWTSLKESLISWVVIWRKKFITAKSTC